MNAPNDDSPSLYDLVRDVRDEMRDSFKTINGRIDGMVTRELFEAEIRRLDTAHSEGGRVQEAQTAAIAKRLEGKIEGDKTFNRWLIGTLIAGSGGIIAIVSLINNLTAS